MARRTEGFRKLYCGAISANTSEKMLQAKNYCFACACVFDCHSQAYFTEFGEVRSVSVIRDKDTGLSKGFGFVSMQASEGAKKALLRQVPKKPTTLLQVSESENYSYVLFHLDTRSGQSNNKSDPDLPSTKSWGGKAKELWSLEAKAAGGESTSF